ncbi:hypothetical protein [Anabaena sp. UHCC 0399]|uniref:hypothetical protein n=1 Tax=Anabaena sp. UHCC 0399 TaxID=3110238 RepID=UPI002B2082D2|nr:hypothetical protein [Anabaena sp. UHCC 0399]MEA5565156.1 hypothetical protein [Anabaena sp. UHCC 0399]
MKLFNNLLAVEKYTTVRIHVAIFKAILGYVANLVPTNKSNNKCVQNENISLKKFLTNRQLAQGATPPLCIAVKSLIMTPIDKQLVSNSLAYGEKMIFGGTTTDTCTTRTGFIFTAGSDNC